MADKPLVGPAVERLAASDHIGDREPLTIRGIVTSVVSAVLLILVFQGIISQEESDQIDQGTRDFLALAETGALVVVGLMPLFTAIWARLKTFSPKSAAKIAVLNANNPFKADPVMNPPP